MGFFDQSNYIVNTGIIEQVFQCTTKMILLAKMIKLWTFYENVVREFRASNYEKAFVRPISRHKMFALCDVTAYRDLKQ